MILGQLKDTKKIHWSDHKRNYADHAIPMALKTAWIKQFTIYTFYIGTYISKWLKKVIDHCSSLIQSILGQSTDTKHLYRSNHKQN